MKKSSKFFLFFLYIVIDVLLIKSASAKHRRKLLVKYCAGTGLGGAGQLRVLG
jgi:hypothetical protein